MGEKIRLLNRQSKERRIAHQRLRAEWVDVQITELEQETAQLEGETKEENARRSRLEAELEEVEKEIKRMEEEQT